MSKQNKLPSHLSDLLDNEEDKIRYEEYFLSPVGRAIRELLVKHVERRLKLSVEKSDKVGQFEKPAWSEYQASAVGQREELRHILSLLTR